MKPVAALIAPLILSSSGMVAFAGADDALTTRVNLQATMQAFIEKRSTEKGFAVVDEASGTERFLTPTAPHANIFQTGGFYVLCYDFAAADGQPVNVDFYIGTYGDGYKVVSVKVDQHQKLEALVSKGKARAL